MFILFELIPARVGLMPTTILVGSYKEFLAFVLQFPESRMREQSLFPVGWYQEDFLEFESLDAPGFLCR